MERRTLILASTLARAMDYDFNSASVEDRPKLVDIWTETWLRPDWAMCTKAGRFTGNQIQFVARFIEITQLMHDRDRQLQAKAEYSQAKTGSNRSNVYATQ